MTPLQGRPWLYVDSYGAIYRRYAREFDKRAAEFIKPSMLRGIKAGLLSSGQEIPPYLLGCWRGRQFANALGMPYDVYIDLAFVQLRMRLGSATTCHQPYQPP
jgi:hypothetical protein